jgi:short chain dehydrogenase
MTGSNENGSFAGKVAFVTGAGSGLGRTTALAFARKGAAVVVADLSDQGNQETARMITELGGRAVPVRCDATRLEDVQAALSQAVDAFGSLDIAFSDVEVARAGRRRSKLSADSSARSPMKPTMPALLNDIQPTIGSTGALNRGDSLRLIRHIAGDPHRLATCRGQRIGRASANARAAASPMPELAPVTRASWPAKS